jgi:hypothetical protein
MSTNNKPLWKSLFNQAAQDELALNPGIGDILKDTSGRTYGDLSNAVGVAKDYWGNAAAGVPEEYVEALKKTAPWAIGLGLGGAGLLKLKRYLEAKKAYNNNGMEKTARPQMPLQDGGSAPGSGFGELYRQNELANAENILANKPGINQVIGDTAYATYNDLANMLNTSRQYWQNQGANAYDALSNLPIAETLRTTAPWMIGLGAGGAGLLGIKKYLDSKKKRKKIDKQANTSIGMVKQMAPLTHVEKTMDKVASEFSAMYGEDAPEMFEKFCGYLSKGEIR